MKRRSSIAAVAAVAASATAITAAASYSAALSSGSAEPVHSCDPQGGAAGAAVAAATSHGKPEDRFAPRFDGLRFIETLVTAHR